MWWKEPICFYCLNKSNHKDKISRTLTEAPEINIICWVKICQKWDIYARLNECVNPEHLIAAEIHYHLSCYTKLKNEAKCVEEKVKSAEKADFTKYFSKLAIDPVVVDHVIEYLSNSSGPVALKKLFDFYMKKLELHFYVSKWRIPFRAYIML